MAFGAGGVVYIGLRSTIEKLASGEYGGGPSGMWMIILAVATDLASDGLVLGAGSAVSTPNTTPGTDVGTK